MNILTYNLCLKPIVFELLNEHLQKKKATIFSIDFNSSKEIYDKFLSSAIFCDQRNAKKGLDQGGNKIPFNLNKKIIKDFSETENVIYRIMSRYEKDYTSFNFRNRKNHYFDLLKYAFGLINKYKINTVVFFDYPHHMESYILYKVSEYLKIKIVIISYLYLGEYRLVVDSSLKNRFNEFKKEKKLTEFKQSDLLYFNQILENQKHAKPFYLVENKSFKHVFYYFIKDLYRSYLNGFFTESNNFIKVKSNQKLQNTKFPSEIYSSFLMLSNRMKIINLEKVYLNLCEKKPDLQKKYILFSPNLQPEASTLPMAGIYSDYQIILDTILEVLPNDWVIYYKEHPLVFNTLKESYLSLDKEYYYNIINKKIKFVDYRLDTFKYIDNANIIITPTGSIGLESLIRGKRVGFFGNPWWSYFDDPTYIDGHSKMKQLIDRSNSKSKINNSHLLKNYIRTFEHSYHWEGFMYESYKDLKDNLKLKNIDATLIQSIRKYLIDNIDNIE